MQRVLPYVHSKTYYNSFSAHRLLMIIPFDFEEENVITATCRLLVSLET